ncbi:MAG: hypothetical protein DMF87_17350 [Acidobacteria bacterium]|nr:MAG: hypothetical protein DMF87_17350 [Acidobacteriota bacterium]
MVKSSSQRRDGGTEQRILDAAHAVFVRRGTAGARTQEIAKEAGVNSALLHYYFRTKDRLAAAVFQRATGQLMPVVIRILGSDLEIEQKVEQVIDVERTRVFKVLKAQIDARVRAKRMHRVAPEQFVIDLLALCVFPFAARPMVMALLGFDQSGFQQFISRRRKELPPFFLRALRP